MYVCMYVCIYVCQVWMDGYAMHSVRHISFFFPFLFFFPFPSGNMGILFWSTTLRCTVPCCGAVLGWESSYKRGATRDRERERERERETGEMEKRSPLLYGGAWKLQDPTFFSLCDPCSHDYLMMITWWLWGDLVRCTDWLEQR